jgi:hypothetical protein
MLSVVVDNQAPEEAAAKPEEAEEAPATDDKKTGTPTPIDVGASQSVAFKQQEKEENPAGEAGPELEINTMFLQFYCFVLGLGVW